MAAMTNRKRAKKTPAKRKATKRKATKRKAPAKRKASARKPPADELTVRAVGDAVANYLRSLEAGDHHGAVAIGGLRGFPTFSDDPDTLERAAAQLDQRALVEPSPLKRLKTRQRVIDLRQSATRLRAVSNGTSPRDLFVKHGKAWADKNDVSYAAFRECGVPAAVLREANITR